MAANITIQPIPTTITTAITSILTTTSRAANLTHAVNDLPAYTLVLTSLSSSLSIIGAIVIFVTFVRIAEIRNFTRTLLLCLTVADTLTAVGNFLGTVRYLVNYKHHRHGDSSSLLVQRKTDELCIVQSFITTFSSMASFFWTVVIAAYLLGTVICQSDRLRSRLMFALYSVVCWGVPVGITMAAVFKGALGEDQSISTGTWCWIKTGRGVSERTAVTWMFMTGKAWEVACYIISFVLYVILVYQLCKRRQRYQETDFSRIESGLRDEDRNYLYLWFIVYMLRIWGTVRFFFAVSHPKLDPNNLGRAQFVLLNIQCFGDSGQAFWNCVMCCLFDQGVRGQLCRCCSDRYGQEQPLLHPGDRNFGSVNNVAT